MHLLGELMELVLNLRFLWSAWQNQSNYNIYDILLSLCVPLVESL